MELPSYDLKANSLSITFLFTSTGPNGNIKKLILYREFETKNIYHLGFGDYNEATGEIDYLSVGNNSDTEVILATVAASLRLFFAEYPGAQVYAQGSTRSRTRLYRMGITKYFQQIKDEYIILGFHGGSWAPFRAGTWYDAFMVKQK